MTSIEAGTGLAGADGVTGAWSLEAEPTAGLLRLHAGVLEELRRRGVVRSSNNPVADLAEHLATIAFRLKLAPKSARGYDASGRGLRFQVKARRLTPHNRSRQLGFFRGLDDAERPFDVLIGMLFEADFTVYRAAWVPFGIVKLRASPVEYVKASRFILADSVWAIPGVRDVTGIFRGAAEDGSVRAIGSFAGHADRA
jgi:hypothetical protein